MPHCSNGVSEYRGDYLKINATITPIVAIIKRTNREIRYKATVPHNGAVTHHHDQSMTAVNFNVKKVMKVKITNKE
jgi:hypothetical protein